MISLTIDGRRVSVAPGTTVLDAARQLDIRIPTLCHVPGLEPASSCFVCAVQVKGQRGLSPSCARPAAEGMEVATENDAVRGARRVAPVKLGQLLHLDPQPVHYLLLAESVNALVHRIENEG